MSRLVPAALYVLAAIVAGVAMVGPGSGQPRQEARDRGLARAAIERIAAAEQEGAARSGHYVPFGPDATERRAALPGVALDAAAEAAFRFDAALDRKGALRISAVSRAEAVRAGRVAPLLETADLPPKP